MEDFHFLKDPESITLLDIVKIIDGDDIFKNCIMHNGSCADVRHSKKICPLHDDYERSGTSLINLFRNKTYS